MPLQAGLLNVASGWYLGTTLLRQFVSLALGNTLPFKINCQDFHKNVRTNLDCPGVPGNVGYFILSPVAGCIFPTALHAYGYIIKCSMLLYSRSCSRALTVCS